MIRQRLGPSDLVKERHRETRSFVWLDDARTDLRYAARMLRRSPTLSATAILSLAFGIGANTVVFGLVEGLPLKPLPVAHPGELVNVSAMARHAANERRPDLGVRRSARWHRRIGACCDWRLQPLEYHRWRRRAAH